MLFLCLLCIHIAQNIFLKKAIFWTLSNYLDTLNNPELNLFIVLNLYQVFCKHSEGNKLYGKSCMPFTHTPPTPLHNLKMRE